MNDWQMFRQLQATLQAAVWPGSAATVFAPSSVVIIGGLPIERIINSIRMPACALAPGGSTSDPDHNEEPALIRQDVDIKLVQLVAGDAVGEHAVMGAGRQSNSAEGRGILEIGERLLAEVSILNKTIEGFDMLFRARSGVAVDMVSQGYLASRAYAFDGWAGVERTYQMAGAMAAAATGTDVLLSWTLPTSRFDISKAILRRASGSTPPPTVTDGSGVVLAADLSESVTDTPGAGTWSYSLFVQYNDGLVGNSEARTAIDQVTT